MAADAGKAYSNPGRSPDCNPGRNPNADQLQNVLADVQVWEVVNRVLVEVRNPNLDLDPDPDPEPDPEPNLILSLTPVMLA